MHQNLQTRPSKSSETEPRVSATVGSPLTHVPVSSVHLLLNLRLFFHGGLYASVSPRSVTSVFAHCRLLDPPLKTTSSEKASGGLCPPAPSCTPLYPERQPDLWKGKHLHLGTDGSVSGGGWGLSFTSDGFGTQGHTSECQSVFMSEGFESDSLEVAEAFQALLLLKFQEVSEGITPIQSQLSIQAVTCRSHTRFLHDGWMESQQAGKSTQLKQNSLRSGEQDD